MQQSVHAMQLNISNWFYNGWGYAPPCSTTPFPGSSEDVELLAGGLRGRGPMGISLVPTGISGLAESTGQT
jgi:hypothetical protein